MHPGLEADPETLRALKELGLKPASAETTFKDLRAKTPSPIMGPGEVE